jgi:transcriptional regulator of arginine metabolism
MQNHAHIEPPNPAPAAAMPIDHEIRATRQRAILELLGEVAVTSQAELVQLLRRRGIGATQSSVSRDLADLGVARLAGRYVPRPEPDPGLGSLAGLVRVVKPAGSHLTVVLTIVGSAQSVALAIDRAAWPEVVGTMAGDDTVFVATADGRDQQKFIRRLRSSLLES